MIRPILEYVNPVWSPHIRRDIDKLEQIQRQSARFIMADFSRFSSVTNMLIDLNIPSLEHRSQVSSITLLYKIAHNLIDIVPVDLITVTSNTRGHDQRFHHIYARTNQYSNSFFPRSIRLWNSLPPDLIQQQSLHIFKYHLKLLLLSLPITNPIVNHIVKHFVCMCHMCVNPQTEAVHIWKIIIILFVHA